MSVNGVLVRGTGFVGSEQDEVIGEAVGLESYAVDGEIVGGERIGLGDGQGSGVDNGDTSNQENKCCRDLHDKRIESLRRGQGLQRRRA